MRAKEQAALDEVTRLVALALRDAGLRQTVRNDLRASRHTPEHKLDFANYLHGHSGGILLSKMAKESGKTREEVLRLVAQVRPLEFYMPVPEHRVAWRGGPDLLVANLLEERTGPANALAAPVAFDLAGGRVSLSAEAPASVPTLAIVPVETDFDTPLDDRYENRDAGDREVIGTWHLATPRFLVDTRLGEDTETGIGIASPPPPGLYMSFSYVSDDGEGWLKGDPEIEVHVHGPAPDAVDRTIASDLSCAGDRQSGYRQFNQDSRSWSGSVLLFTRQEIDTYNLANFDGFNVLFWEDDDTACVVKSNKHLPSLLAAGAVGVWLGPAVLTNNCDPFGCVLGGGLFLAGAYHSANFLLSNDDYLGAAMHTAGSQYSYPDANFVILNGSEVNGRAMLEIRN